MPGRSYPIGSGTAMAAVVLPTCALSFAYITRVQSCETLRSKAIDPDFTIYPRPTELEVAACRQVEPPDAPNASGKGTTLSMQSNPGFVHAPGLLTFEENKVALGLLEKEIEKHGMPLDARTMAAFDAQLPAGVSRESLGSMRILSGITESVDRTRVEWGSGEGIKMDRLPGVLRHISDRMQLRYPTLGALRNVSILYSPDGALLRNPKGPLRWVGNDYVVMGLNARPSPKVITFSPMLRGRFDDYSVLRRHSWTTQDVDVLMEPGTALRVFGRARFHWGWGVRPGGWYGHCSNRIDPTGFGLMGDESRAPSGWMARLFGSQRSAASQESGSAPAAMLVFGYEGPTSLERTRHWAWFPEHLMYRREPVTSDFEVWGGAQMPTEQEVYGDGVVGLLKWIYNNITPRPIGG